MCVHYEYLWFSIFFYCKFGQKTAFLQKLSVRDISFISHLSSPVKTEKLITAVSFICCAVNTSVVFCPVIRIRLCSRITAFLFILFGFSILCLFFPAKAFRNAIVVICYKICVKAHFTCIFIRFIFQSNGYRAKLFCGFSNVRHSFNRRTDCCRNSQCT